MIESYRRAASVAGILIAGSALAAAVPAVRSLVRSPAAPQKAPDAKVENVGAPPTGEASSNKDDTEDGDVARTPAQVGHRPEPPPRPPHGPFLPPPRTPYLPTPREHE